jgi:hypothetical protein
MTYERREETFISRRTEHKNAMVSFAKIEHARGVGKKKHKITGALSFFNPFARHGGPEKCQTLPLVFSDPMQKILCVYFLSL